MQNLNETFPSFHLTQVSQNLTHSELINIRLKVIDDKIEEIVQKAKEKGIDIHNTSWIQEMRAVRARVSQQMQLVMSFGNTATGMDHASEKALGELNQIHNRISTGLSLATDAHAEAGKAHHQFQLYLNAAEPEFLISFPNGIPIRPIKPVLENPYQAEMISDVKEALGSIRFIGAGLERIGEAVFGTVKAICKAPLPADPAFLDCIPFSPLPAQETVSGEKFCKSMLSSATTVGKAVLEAVHLKEPVKQGVEWWKSLDGSSTAEALIAHGIPDEEASELAQQYVSDVKSIAVVGTTSAAFSVVKMGFSTISAARLNVAKEVRIADSTSTFSALDHTGRVVVLKEVHKAFYSPVQSLQKPFINPMPSYTKGVSQLKPQPSLSVGRIAVGSDHYINRQITMRTKMTPEDIGISSLEFFKNKRPFASSDYHLEGWMTRKGDIFKIALENIRVPEGRLFNWLTVMSNFKKMAKANQSSLLQFEAQIINEKLLEVMIRRFGEPSMVFKNRYKELTEYQVFKIPL